ncbi:MAG: hypothetical protein NTX59_04830 [Elusimicrobia bacterium]|nr:hypothetical protein [Elusimicrobiota bacterium]
MKDNLILPLLGFAAGLVMLVLGIIKRGRARSYKDIPCGGIGSQAGGARQFITGKAHSPALVSSPVTKTACLFYLETTDRKERERIGTASSSQGEWRSRWVRESTNANGGFFVRDGSGTALVVPVPESVDFRKPAATESNDSLLPDNTSGAIRKSELIIAEDEDVAVLGRPQSLGEFMQYLRQNTDICVPSGLLTELARLENDPGSSGMPCFFGPGVEKVADQSYGDYITGIASSASLLLQIGIVIAAIGAGALIYALK